MLGLKGCCAELEQSLAVYAVMVDGYHSAELSCEQGRTWLLRRRPIPTCTSMMFPRLVVMVSQETRHFSCCGFLPPT
jgi:hypothetical protein